MCEQWAYAGDGVEVLERGAVVRAMVSRASCDLVIPHNPV